LLQGVETVAAVTDREANASSVAMGRIGNCAGCVVSPSIKGNSVFKGEYCAGAGLVDLVREFHIVSIVSYAIAGGVIVASVAVGASGFRVGLRRLLRGLGWHECGQVPMGHRWESGG
jgi:hypothetical protein